MLSVIIPSYNEELMIEKTAGVISDILAAENIENELIFVDDGSKDDTWDEILYQAEIRPNVRGLHFSRNFGKESAIMAGLNKAEGDCCAVIDCDLQMPPQTMVEMYRLWEQGYEIIEGRKRSRGHETVGHAFAARMFYAIISRSCGFDMEDASDFKLLDRKVVNALINMREKNGFFRAMTTWVGFSTTEVEFDVQEREAGVSKWSTGGLFRYAIRNITSFSTVPMQAVTFLGVVMFVVSVIFSVIALVQKFAGVAENGFTTIIILQLFSASVIMISLGIIGYYIACIYDEIKGRPRFIISRECGKGLQPEPLIHEYENEEYEAEEFEESEERPAESEAKKPEEKSAESEAKEPEEKSAESEAREPEEKSAESEAREPEEKSAESEVDETESSEKSAGEEETEKFVTEDANMSAENPVSGQEESQPTEESEPEQEESQPTEESEPEQEESQPAESAEPVVEEKAAPEITATAAEEMLAENSEDDDFGDDDFEIITGTREPKAQNPTVKKKEEPGEDIRSSLEKPVIRKPEPEPADDFDDFEDVLKL